MYQIKKWVADWMNRWKERRNQGRNIQLCLGAYSKQVNLSQIHQTLCFIKKNVMLFGKCT